jgi:hypothetical protein
LIGLLGMLAGEHLLGFTRGVWAYFTG